MKNGENGSKDDLQFSTAQSVQTAETVIVPGRVSACIDVHSCSLR